MPFFQASIYGRIAAKDNFELYVLNDFCTKTIVEAVPAVALCYMRELPFFFKKDSAV